MGATTFTIENFATFPVGVAVVWALMHLIDINFPLISTRTKVLAQLGISLLYTIIATTFFLSGTPKQMAQQGVVLFCSVCFSQVFGYETVTKLAGIKGHDALSPSSLRKVKKTGID